MKKTIILLSIFCLLLTTYKSMATGGCSMTEPYCSSSDGGDYYQGYYMTVSPSYTFTFYMIASGSGSYAYISWPTTGPYSYYSYYDGSPNSPYYQDPDAYDGYVTLGAFSYEGGYASVNAAW